MINTDTYIIRSRNNDEFKLELLFPLAVNRFTANIIEYAQDPTHGWQPSEVGGQLSYDKWGQLVQYIIVAYNLVTYQGYDNVLIIPNFTNDKYPRVQKENGLVEDNISGNMIGVVNTAFSLSDTTNIYTAFPEGDNFAKYLLEMYDSSKVLTSNKMYEMGDETYEITVPEGVKFDAVVLIGIDINEGESFSASDIKDDFASYCTSDFELMDIYHRGESDIEAFKRDDYLETLSQTTRLTGDEKDNIAMSNFINNYSYRKDGFGDTDFVNHRLPKSAEIIRNSVKIY